MLAHFAEAIRPAARAVLDDALDRPQTLLARRRQLVVMRGAEKQRLAKATDPVTQRSLKAMIAALDQQLGVLDKAIGRLIGADPALAERKGGFGLRSGLWSRSKPGTSPSTTQLANVAGEALGMARVVMAFELRAQPVEEETGDRWRMGAQCVVQDNPPKRGGQLVAEQFGPVFDRGLFRTVAQRSLS